MSTSQAEGVSVVRRWGWLWPTVLYVVTFLFELLIGAKARYWAVLVLFYPVYLLTSILAWLSTTPGVGQTVAGQLGPGVFVGFQNTLARVNTIALPIAQVAAYAPLVASLLAFVLPGGLLMTYHALGARLPSRQERSYIDDVINRLRQADPKIRRPAETYIIDKVLPDSFLIGSTLYLTRGAVTDSSGNQARHLGAIIAHEMGHLNSLDGRFVLALRRFVLPPVYWLSRSADLAAPGAAKIGGAAGGRVGGCLASGFVWLASLLLSLAGGGIGVALLSPLWTPYWRRRDYVADRFAAQFGYGDALLDYLKSHQVFDIPVPYIGPGRPYSELRIDFLKPGGQIAAADERASNRVRAGAWAVAVGIMAASVVLYVVGIDRYNNYLYGIEDNEWRVTNVCRTADCPTQEPLITTQVPPNTDIRALFYGNTYRVQVTNLNGKAPTQTAAVGSLRYITKQRISLDLVSNLAGEFPTSGIYTIEKQGNQLILRGDIISYWFVNSSPPKGPWLSILSGAGAPAATPQAVSTKEAQSTAAPASSSATVGAASPPTELTAVSDRTSAQAIIGKWAGVSGDVQGWELEFTADGRMIFRPKGGETVEHKYRVEGNHLQGTQANGVTFGYDIRLDGDTLTLDPAGQQSVWKRLT